MSSKTLVPASLPSPSPSILAKYAPATGIIEHDPENQTYDFPNGLKQDLAIIWWCERNLQVPAGRRLLITKIPAEGELKPEQYVVEVKSRTIWPLRPIVNAFIGKPKGRLSAAVRRYMLKTELKDRSCGRTSFVCL